MHREGRRVVLREATGDDAEGMLDYLSDPGVAHFLTHGPLTLPDVRRRVALRRAEDPWFNVLFAVVFAGEVIGEVHAWNVGEHRQPASADPSEVWIGYVLKPDYQGRGLASEAVRLLLEWLRERGSRVAFANLYADNDSSKQLLEHLGFDVVLEVPAELDGTGKQRSSLRMALTL